MPLPTTAASKPTYRGSYRSHLTHWRRPRKQSICCGRRLALELRRYPVSTHPASTPFAWAGDKLQSPGRSQVEQLQGCLVRTTSRPTHPLTHQPDTRAPHTHTHTDAHGRRRLDSLLHSLPSNYHLPAFPKATVPPISQYRCSLASPLLKIQNRNRKAVGRQLSQSCCGPVQSVSSLPLLGWEACPVAVALDTILPRPPSRQ